MVRGAAPKAHFAANSGRICFDWLAGGDECGANVEIRGEGGNTGANAKVAKVTQKTQKGIPKLFENALKQCLCGLRGINGLQGAWGLVVGVLPCASVVLAAVVAAACTFQNWICFDTEANIAIRHSRAGGNDEPLHLYANLE